MMYANEDWEGIIEQAQRQGSARGLPKPPAGLRADGQYSLNRTKLGDGGVKRTLYYGVKGDWTTVGWWTEGAQETPAPQVNGTGPRPSASTGSASGSPSTGSGGEEIDGPEPLIMLTPVAGGAWRLNGYGVELAEVIRALRLSLVHLVARQAGVVIIDELAAPEMAVVAPLARLPRLPQPRNDKRKRPGSGKMRTTVRYPDEFDDELEEE